MNKEQIKKIHEFCEECDKLYDWDNNYDENRLFECEKLKEIRGE